LVIDILEFVAADFPGRKHLVISYDVISLAPAGLCVQTTASTSVSVYFGCSVRGRFGYSRRSHQRFGGKKMNASSPLLPPAPTINSLARRSRLAQGAVLFRECFAASAQVSSA